MDDDHADISTTTEGDESAVLTQNDWDKIMSWNQDLPSEVDACFHDLFQQVVKKSPDSPAICSWGDGDYTYRQLDAVSTRLAEHLNENLGVNAPEMPVLICFDKSSIAMLSMLSILKAGGAFVAVDSAYPAARIQAIVHAANASRALVQPTHCHLFDGIIPDNGIVALDPMYLDALPPSSVQSSTTASKASPSNAAYIHFTSGSTGTPKGIMIEHRQLCTAVSALASPMRISSTSRVLQFASYIFDLSFGDIFVTLSQGGCICVPSEHERINDLAGAMRRMAVNNACLVPSVARVLHPADVPALQTLLLGGEALLQANLERWADNVALSAMYGPSECTIWCTSKMGLEAQSQANNIGRGYGARLWITKSDDSNRLAPIGCIGELLIEGPVVARGYLDAGQTRQSFVENLDWAKSSRRKRRRFYRTGDLVRYNIDGTVSFIGRKDSQIKLHGRRIEIGDIEHHLASHPLVRQAMVMVPNAGVHATRLVGVTVLGDSNSTHDVDRRSPSKAWIISSTEPHLSHLADIKDFLSRKLPAYMVPQHWVVLQDIPLLISDKMDRVSVKKFVEGLTTATAKPEKGGPQSEKDQAISMRRHRDDDLVEKRLQSLWTQVLSTADRQGVDEKDEKVHDAIAANQDFSSLGGDSFSAMDLVARCRAEGFPVTVEDLLGTDGMTIRKMVRIVQKRGLESARKVPTLPQLKLRPLWWDA